MHTNNKRWVSEKKETVLLYLQGTIVQKFQNAIEFLKEKCDPFNYDLE